MRASAARATCPNRFAGALHPVTPGPVPCMWRCCCAAQGAAGVWHTAVQFLIAHASCALVAATSRQRVCAIMDSGFEPLPPRDGGRHASKRKRAATTEAADGTLPEGAGAASGHSQAPHTQNAEAAAVTGILDSNEGNYEYLDHTADVQIHSCTWIERSHSPPGSGSGNRLFAHCLAIVQQLTRRARQFDAFTPALSNS
jgi:hypothetical protein